LQAESIGWQKKEEKADDRRLSLVLRVFNGNGA
jgi:hypothetical protein